MINILVSDDSPQIKKILIKCLETSGFEVINGENNCLRIHLKNQSLSTNGNTQELNNHNYIFPSISRLHSVFEFIESHYRQSIGLREVAQAVGYSSAYLTDLVRKLTGKTVNSWIIERRISEARRLLLETNDSVEKIALDVGYKNLNHFYKQFRDYYNSTPHAWRESQRFQFG